MTATYIDEVPVGTMIYSAAGVLLGIIREHLMERGFREPIMQRVLDNGKWKDRYVYRRRLLYRYAKRQGMVFVK